GRHDRAEHHDHAVHGGELVEELRLEQLYPRGIQLRTQQQRQQSTDHQHGERENQVHRTDVFVVRGEQPSTPTGGCLVCVVVPVVCVTRLHVVYRGATHGSGSLLLHIPVGW